MLVVVSHRPADVRPELQEEIAAGVSCERHSPGGHHDSYVGAGLWIVSSRETGAGEVAKDIGVVKTRGTVIAAGDKHLLRRVDSARLNASIGLAKVARVFVREDWKQAVGEEAIGGHANGSCSDTLSEGRRIAAVFGISIDQLLPSGADYHRNQADGADLFMQPEHPLVAGGSGRKLLSRVDDPKPCGGC